MQQRGVELLRVPHGLGCILDAQAHPSDEGAAALATMEAQQWDLLGMFTGHVLPCVTDRWQHQQISERAFKGMLVLPVSLHAYLKDIRPGTYVGKGGWRVSPDISLPALPNTNQTMLCSMRSDGQSHCAGSLLGHPGHLDSCPPSPVPGLVNQERWSSFSTWSRSSVAVRWAPGTSGAQLA